VESADSSFAVGPATQKFELSQRDPEPNRYENLIRTSKYTPSSFLPMNMLHQLLKPMSIYYGIICFLQSIKPISITGGKPTVLTSLVFVTLCSMIKDWSEDKTR
jgi:hypothetical protein